MGRVLLVAIALSLWSACSPPSSGSGVMDLRADGGHGIDAAAAEEDGAVDLRQFRDDDGGDSSVAVTIDVTDDVLARRVELALRVTHLVASELRFELTGPNGESIAFESDHRVSCGVEQTVPLDELEGAAMTGQWTLTVKDIRPCDAGTLHSVALLVMPEAD